MRSTGKLLEIIGNETRRKILALLQDGPHYGLQISEKLNVTQPAILKHLARLERMDLVESSMKKSEFGAPRKYYKICDSVKLELEVVIGPREFRVTRRPSATTCPIHIHEENVIRQLTEGINEAKNVNEKAAKAQSLINEVNKLLSCKGFDEENWNCRGCHKTALLRKKVSQIIAQIAVGDITLGLKMLTPIMDLF